MIGATYHDKPLIVDILAQAFDDNKSVNYIVKQDRKRLERIKALMRYSFDVCYSRGKVVLSQDKQACALILFPDAPKAFFKAIAADLRLISQCTGIANVVKAMKRESIIKSVQPKEPLYYLWFIGTKQEARNRGIGSELMRDIIADAAAMGRTLCLETSTLANIAWYQKFGLSIYNKRDFGYTLHFLRTEK